MVAQGADGGGGDRADADLDRGSVGDALGDHVADHAVLVPHLGRRHLEQRVVGLDPSGDLGDVDLVLAAGAGHLRVALQEERRLPDEAGHVVGVQAEREPPVAIGHRGRGHHQRARGHVVEDVRHLREVGGGEVDATLGEAGPGDVGEEVRDVAQPGVHTVQVGPVAQRVHLVDPHALEGRPGGVEGGHEGVGLAVGEGDDDVAVGLRVLDDGGSIAAVCASECIAHGCLLGWSAVGKR